MLTVQLAAELRDSGIKVNSADPGYTATDLNGRRGLKTIPEGAAAAVRLALIPDEGPTGGFFNASGPQPQPSRLIVTQRVHWRSCTHRDPPVQIAETKQRDGSGPGVRGRLGGPRQGLRVDILTDVRQFAILNRKVENPVVLERPVCGFDSPSGEADNQNPVPLRYELGGLWVRSFHRFVSLLK